MVLFLTSTGAIPATDIVMWLQTNKAGHMKKVGEKCEEVERIVKMQGDSNSKKVGWKCVKKKLWKRDVNGERLEMECVKGER